MEIRVFQCLRNAVDLTIKSPQLSELNSLRLVQIHIVEHFLNLLPAEPCIHLQ